MFYLFPLNVVPRYSAIILGLKRLQEVALEADHKVMVKYPPQKDEHFQRVIRRLLPMVNCANTKIEENWNRWERIKSKAFLTRSL
jgi:hypothetical protein